MNNIAFPRTASLLTDDLLVGSVIYTDGDLVVPGLFVTKLTDPSGYTPLIFSTRDLEEEFGRMGVSAPVQLLKVVEATGEESEMTVEQYLLSFEHDRLEIPEGGLPPFPALHFVGEIRKVAPLFVKDQSTNNIIEHGLEMQGGS